MLNLALLLELTILKENVPGIVKVKRKQFKDGILINTGSASLLHSTSRTNSSYFPGFI